MSWFPVFRGGAAAPIVSSAAVMMRNGAFPGPGRACASRVILHRVQHSAH